MSDSKPNPGVTGASRSRELVDAMLAASRSVLRLERFEITARTIFDQACRLTGATAGYVALLSDDGQENELVFLEAGNRTCTVDSELPMPIRGLRARAYRENRAVWNNDFMRSEWVEYLPGGHVDLDNVLFAPLVIEGVTRGILGLANKPGGFAESDGELASALGDMCAVALHNSRTVERLEATVEELENALAEVRQLRGIIPICSACKKIRDEAGYWQQVEDYIRDHTDAVFTHGLCDSCVQLYVIGGGVDGRSR